MESLRIRKAENGSITALSGSIKIHSSYNPEQEAERYISRLHLSSPSSILIIGSGLGYLDAALQKKFPDTTIIAIHLNPATFHNRLKNSESNIKRWHPHAPTPLATFLSEHLDESSTPGLKIISWPPACQTWPQIATQATHIIASHVRRHSGNITTTSAFGRLWLRNILRNYLQHDEILQPTPINTPVVICASGPSLEHLTPTLLKHRSRYILWALPSSMAALNKVGLRPNLIFSTDPGFWAQLHMRHFPPDIPIAMALCSRPLTQTRPPLFICQEYPGEKYLMDSGTPLTSLLLPATGTVAASAVEAWKKLSTAPLFLAGLDLCWNDLLSHVRPHTFTPWLNAQSTRQNPLNNILWNRARNETSEKIGQALYGPSHKTYADWFNGPALIPFRQRITRLSPPGKTYPSLATSLSHTRADILARHPPIPQISQSRHQPTHTCPLNRHERHQKVHQMLAEWKIQIQQLQQQNSENPEIQQLMYNLDPLGALETRRNPSLSHLTSHKERVLQTIRNLNHEEHIR